MKKLSILGVIIFLTSALFAQETSTAAIKQTINTMMDAMRKGDSALLRSVLAEDMEVQSVADDKMGKIQISTRSAGDLVTQIGTNFSHCGVNYFQLIKTEGGWKIIHIVFTTRKDNCKQ